MFLFIKISGAATLKFICGVSPSVMDYPLTSVKIGINIISHYIK